MEPLDSSNSERNPEVVSVKEWIITYLITAIPVVNIVMLFVWAFGGNTNKNKENWAKAGLIWAAIIIGLYMIFFALFGAALFMGGSSY